MLIETLKCKNPDCGLRFSQLSGVGRGRRCPRCRSDTFLVTSRSSAFEIPQIEKAGKPTLEIVLDNLRSGWNVGSIFRTASGAGVRKIHLCGITPTPEAMAVRKTSLGAENHVAWQYYSDGYETCIALQKQGYHVWALEGGERARSLFDTSLKLPDPLALVLGNELTGIDAGIMDVCENVVYLPMMGDKKSLNVAIAGSIAMYWLRFGRIDLAGG
ncbi:rRNA methylases [Anaerolinea thermolimosa]|mgnify:CR=1 FL=1|uniref:RNA methyltransferase n=1 Tax=Anaerolinea thermolimosa TaxID=229919 RepID=UPI000A065A09|nr:RNA methyltransferase [Anaerolinea thermolimosa]GAP06526.1 rRNA methylases [Anaerolinea thermolimosa]